MTALWTAIAIGLGAGYYVVSCWLYPFAKCRWCDGTGTRSSPTGKAYGLCRHCKGARRLRLGRRAWNWMHNDKRKAARR